MLSQPKVLVVDEDRNILSAFDNFFKRENCSLIPISCINEAIANLLQQRIDLLIIDVNRKMPSEVKLFRYVKELQKNISIIIITSYSDIINEQDAKEFGADYFFLKPLDLNKLRDAVHKCLNISNVC